MKIALFGANGGTGRVLAAQALDAGHQVTAVTRHPETFGLEHERLRVLAGDAMDAASVSKAVAGQDAVLSTLGVPFGKDSITIYSAGAANIVAAMTDHGVRRLACVSSSAVDQSGRNFFPSASTAAWYSRTTLLNPGKFSGQTFVSTRGSGSRMIVNLAYRLFASLMMLTLVRSERSCPTPR